MISKELLSTVLQIEVTKVRDEIKSKANMLYFETTDLFTNREASPCVPSINMYELAHKCKQWALSKGYIFSVYSFNFGCNTEQEHRIRLLIESEVVYYGNYSCMETEVEAIIKACEWIFEQIKNKENK